MRRLQGRNGYGTVFVNALSGGDIELPALTTAAGVRRLKTDSATSTLNASALTTLTRGSINDGGVTVTLTDLSDGDSSSFYVSGGVTLSLPGLKSCTNTAGFYDAYFEAADANSVLDVSSLTSVGQLQGYLHLQATGGGQVLAGALTTISTPTTASSPTFSVTFDGKIPTFPAGSPSVYVSSFDIYVSINGGAWSLYKTVSPPSQSDGVTIDYPGQSDTVYAFYSVATDTVSNEAPAEPVVQASVSVPALNTPETSVSSSSTYNGDGTFRLDLSGTDAKGSGLAYIEVYAAIDAGAYEPIGAAIPAGAAGAGGVYTATATYAIPAADYGSSHTFKFYSVGIDAAGLRESAPSMQDASISATSSEPAQVSLSSLTVEHGAAERSYLRYLDLNFNDATTSVLQSIVDSVVAASPEVTLTHYGIDGSGPGTAVSLSGLLAVVDNAIEVDFGAGGIGGNPSSNAADGYYALTFTPTSGPSRTIDFFRLLGDVNDDGSVDMLDINDIAAARGQSSSQIATAIGVSPTSLTPLGMDANGDGVVNNSDLLLASRARGRKITGTPPG